MRAIIREVGKELYEKLFDGIPAMTHDIEKCEELGEVNIIVHNAIAIEQTKDKLTRVSFGHNKIHPYTIDINPACYYQIEIF